MSDNYPFGQPIDPHGPFVGVVSDTAVPSPPADCDLTGPNEPGEVARLTAALDAERAARERAEAALAMALDCSTATHGPDVPFGCGTCLACKRRDVELLQDCGADDIENGCGDNCIACCRRAIAGTVADLDDALDDALGREAALLEEAAQADALIAEWKATSSILAREGARTNGALNAALTREAAAEVRQAFGAAVLAWQEEHARCPGRLAWEGSMGGLPGLLLCYGCGAARELAAPTTEAP